MSDVLEIEVDGAPPPKGGHDGETPPPSWGMPAAIAVAGVLLLAVIVVVRSAPQPVASSAPPASSVPSTRLPPDPDDGILAAARAAMSAWGQFAVTGDLALLDGHFHSEGPQYRQLVAEAPTIANLELHGGHYEVDTTGSVRSLSSNRAEVRVTVVWQRPGEPDQRKSWVIDMRRSPGSGWTVWTTRSAVRELERPAPHEALGLRLLREGAASAPRHWAVSGATGGSTVANSSLADGADLEGVGPTLGVSGR